MVLEKILESPLDCKENKLTGKDPDDGKDRRQEEKGTTEDEMIGCHHQLNGCGFEQALGDGEGEGSLVCCSPRSRKELDMTEQLNSDNVPVDVDLLTEEVLSGCPFL